MRTERRTNMKLLKYILLFLTLNISAVEVTIVATCPSVNDVKAHGNPITMIKLKSTCTVDMGTGNKAPIKIISSSSVAEGETATLNGSTITDPDGTIVSYQWVQKLGETVQLTNGDQSIATFPTPDQGQELVFWVYTTDNDSAVTFSSFTVTTLAPLANEAPIANAGADDTFNENIIATLNCNASTDVNNNIESRVWTQTVGTAVTIILPEQGIASYTPPDVSSSTPLTFQCEVTDTGALSDTDTVVHTIEAVSTGTVYYVSDCEAGKDDDCIAGSDSNDGLSMANAWKTYDKAQDIFASLDPGDEIRFAKGGSFLVAGSTKWINTSSTAENPLIIADYVPTWQSGDEGKPIITQTADSYVFSFRDGGSAEVEQGYNMLNLSLICTAVDPIYSAGVLISNDVDDVILDNLDIDGCNIGVYSNSGSTCSESAPTCNRANDRLTLRNSNITNSPGMGFLGEGNDLVIENNFFTANGTDATYHHNLYISGDLDTGRISGNTLYQSALNGSGECAAVSLVVHGVVNDLTIDNNTIYEDMGKVTWGCQGIAIDHGYVSYESFTNIIIRDNIITNLGRVSIGVSECINCIIESNDITQNQTVLGTSTGIKAPSKDPNGQNAVLTGLTVRGNEITFGNDASGTAITVGTEGTNHVITNNVVVYGGVESFTCISTDLAAEHYTISGNTCP